jgi:hypothetical protein
MTLLKLAAFDPDDLSVLSAHVQDAVTTVGDIVWEPRHQRLIVSLNRFDWAAATAKDECQRRRAALRFDRVTAVKAQGLSPQAPDVVVNLLAVTFEPGAAPAGHVMLVCSGGKGLRLDVECLEASLTDLGPVWAASAKPSHPAG